MSYKTQIHVTDRKRSAELKLAARVAVLKDRGLDEIGIQRDSHVKKIKADIRQAREQLVRIAEQEKMKKKQAQAKAAKLAAQKKEAEAPVVKDQKPKKEKKVKEKKAKTAG